MTVLTFHGDPAVKQRLLERIAAHELADAIHRGAYERWNGAPRRCAVGCSVRDLNDRGPWPGNWHEEMERVLGIPAWLARLDDTVFEHLLDYRAKLWPRRFSEAIPVGVDLAGLADRLAVRRLREECLPLAGEWPEHVVAAIERVIAALEGHGDRVKAMIAARSVVETSLTTPTERSAVDAAYSAAYSAGGKPERATTAAMYAAEAAAAAAAWPTSKQTELDVWSREADRIVEELSAP